MSAQTPLSVTNVKKHFKKKNGSWLEALKGVSFTVEPGSIHGLLGPNGAGKTTLLSLISGIAMPTDGSIAVFGLDPVKESVAVKKMLGIVPQEMVIEPAFSVQEVLYYFGGMYGMSAADLKTRIPEVLEDVGLTDKKDEKAMRLSGGMKRRLMVAKSIMAKPRLLILDEPSAGVDVALRIKLWELVRRLNKEEGTTVVFTTHYLEEAERLCDRITLIDQGVVVADGRLQDMLNDFGKQRVSFTLHKNGVDHVAGAEKIGEDWVVKTENGAVTLAAIANHYTDNLKSARLERATLEEIFLELTHNV
ncbi:ABC transporter ATP-binding protein [Patescibacteria group bacterium]|nr:ABC transporter ATP-binding protein [Patescibacteria group bacterium]